MSEHWQTVRSALDVASKTGILNTCTCNEPVTDWLDDACGHCQLEAAKDALQRLRDRERALVSLLREALDCINADERVRRESWPAGIKSGDLVLDLGDRVHAVLVEELILQR